MGGAVFPKLPSELFETSDATTPIAADPNRSGIAPNQPKYRESKWVDRDSNPGPED